MLIGNLIRPKPEDIQRGEGLWAPFSFNFCDSFKAQCPLSPCDVYRRSPIGRRNPAILAAGLAIQPTRAEHAREDARVAKARGGGGGGPRDLKRRKLG